MAGEAFFIRPRGEGTAGVGEICARGRDRVSRRLRASLCPRYICTRIGIILPGAACGVIELSGLICALLRFARILYECARALGSLLNGN